MGGRGRRGKGHYPDGVPGHLAPEMSTPQPVVTSCVTWLLGRERVSLPLDCCCIARVRYVGCWAPLRGAGVCYVA